MRAITVTAFLAASPLPALGMVQLGPQPRDGISAVGVRGGCGQLQSHQVKPEPSLCPSSALLGPHFCRQDRAVGMVLGLTEASPKGDTAG